jgi:membrane protease YdiL (CAAX protease family)
MLAGYPAPSTSAAVAGVTAGVAGTIAGGALFSWLRERSGTLTAPILLHIVTNSGGLVTALAAAGPAARRGSPAAAGVAGPRPGAQERMARK